MSERSRADMRKLVAVENGLGKGGLLKGMTASTTGTRRVCTSATLAALLSCAVAGCGLPTWSQLIGADKPAPPPPVPVTPPVVMQAPTPPPPPPPPPKPKPEEVIAQFQALKPFDITDGALASLAELDSGLEAVEELKLTGSRVTPDGLAHLPKLTHLARLDVRGMTLNKKALEAIGGTSSIRELRIDGGQVGGEGAPALAGMPNLEVLWAQGLQLSPSNWDALLLNHPLLRELTISYSNMNDLSMTAVGKLSSLKSLTLNDCQVTDLGLAQLVAVEGLEFLNITGCRVTGTGFKAPGAKDAFQQLQTLQLERTPLNEKGGDAVRTMKQLKRLGMAGMPSMQDQHFIRIVKPLDNLEWVNVAGNVGLTGQAMSALAGNENLQEVVLNDCIRVDDMALKFLSKCKNLKRVNVANTACTLQGAVALRQILPDVEIIGLQ